MNLESLLPPVEKKRVKGFPFFGFVPLYEYRYKWCITQAERNYLSRKEMIDSEIMNRKQDEIAKLVNNEAKQLIASKCVFLSFDDYLKPLGILRWHLHAKPKSKWQQYFGNSFPDVQLALTCSHASSSYSEDALNVIAQFRIAKSHDYLFIPNLGSGSACFIEEIIALDSPSTLHLISQEANKYKKIQYYLMFIDEHFESVFFPTHTRRKELFKRIRSRAVEVQCFTKPIL
ncbi:MAG: hypothetical protein WC657_08605 [Candidatus Paceibacterota bacterium]|jgi:hypothetical protein